MVDTVVHELLIHAVATYLISLLVSGVRKGIIEVEVGCSCIK